MNRTVKNVVMVALAIAMCVLLAFTGISASTAMSEASGSSSSSQNSTPPSKPDDSSSHSAGQGSSSSSTSSTDKSDTQSDNKPDSNSSGGGSSNSSGEPPAKPDGDTSGPTDQGNSGNNSNGGEPPAKPDGESSGSGDKASETSSSSTSGSTAGSQSQGQSNSQSGDNTSSGTGGSSQATGDSGQSQGQGGEQGGGQPQGQAPGASESKSVEVPVLYLVALSLEGLILGLLLAYLFASGFNRRKASEVFKNKSNIAVVILSGVLALSLAGFGGNYALLKVAAANQSDTQSQGEGGPGGGQSQSVSYTAQKEITSDETLGSDTYTSSNADENTILATGSIKASLNGTTVKKTGDSDGGDSTSFYGNNSGVLAKDGATLDITGATITTDATGANGVFSYGGSATTKNSSSDGTTVNISDTKITTSKDNSGGIMTTGGGVMNASNLTIATAGTSSAAIRTDRGGGTVNVDGGTYTTTGKGSPAVYSTADVTVKNATLDSQASEGVCIEGKNSVALENVTLTDNNTELNGKSTTHKNIFLYQSMSGDADSGTSKFSAKNSKFTTNTGDTLYVTNTTAEFDLENCEFTNTDAGGNFLRAQADSWGNSGSNGGDVTLNLTNQKVSGNIVIDSVSTLKMNMMSNSTYEGAINSDNSAKSIELKLSSDSKIILTGDTYVTSFENDDASNGNIDFNGHKLYVNGVAIN